VTALPVPERKTFAESIRVTRSVSIPRSEIDFRFSRSSGPGGQHADTSSTRVEALFDVADSRGLTEAERGRVLRKLGPVVRAIAQDERSQLRNRELATERIVEQLREAVKVVRKRTATRPTKAAKERRLEEKKRRGHTKYLRRNVED
jgi:ribosome-associated protein